MINKRKTSGGGLLVSISTFLIAILVIFIFTAYHSHNQLDSLENSAKVFVSNSLRRINFTSINNNNHNNNNQISNNKIISNNLHNNNENDQFITCPPKNVYPTSNPTERINHNIINLGNRIEEISPTLNSVAENSNKSFDPNYHQLKCPHGKILTFWKKLMLKDENYRTPFADYGPAVKYVTFEPDVGGWNNIRMQMELVLVLAYATGRILVLPPDQPMYLLNAGKGHQKAHSFADFFPFDYINKRLPVIEMDEFMRREAITGQLHYNHDKSMVAYPPKNKTTFIGTDRDDRNSMWEYLRNVSACPHFTPMEEFVVIPESPGTGNNRSTLPAYKKKRDIFAAKRKPVYYDDYWQKQKVIHFISKPGLGYRLLEHFYTFIHFEDDAMDRYFKRFVRDYVHYTDIIFCKAALIISELKRLGNGSYSSFHIRRGEFQYKEVKIPADQMMNNVGHLIPKGQLLFIATDEHNKTFFDSFRPRFPHIKFLDDFTALADLKGVNPNLLGMIDQVVCTRGDVFVGTWFSTFSGYITRMRGYLGYADRSNYYGDKNHRDRFQHDELPKFPFYMREWNISWYDIDR
eukprot:gene12435-16679_t